MYNSVKQNKGVRMFKLLKLVILANIIILVTPINALSAKERVKIETEEQLNQFSKEWECVLKGAFVDGFKSHIKLDGQISLKNISANFREEYCPSKLAQLNGKFKRGKLFLKSSFMPAPCPQQMKVTYIIYKDEEGGYYMKGNHSTTTYDGIRRNYTSMCVEHSK